MSFCYFKKSHSGFFACIFCPWVNCCDLRGWVAFPSNPSAMASRPIGCASLASGWRPIHGCRQMSANLLAFVSELVDKCRPTCRQMSATETLKPRPIAKAQRTQRPHPIAGAVPNPTHTVPEADACDNPFMPCLAKAQRTQRPHPIAGAVPNPTYTVPEADACDNPSMPCLAKRKERKGHTQLQGPCLVPALKECSTAFIIK